MSARVTVLLVDDHAVVREGYRRLLEISGGITVVGEASSAAEACQMFCSLEPDVVVMDIGLPGVSGIEALRRILAHEPKARVLMFSMYEDTIFVKRALEAGAAGYLTKAAAPRVLVEAVATVASGHLAAGLSEWREQLVLHAESNRRILMCACTTLSGEDQTPGGYVIVFDDITTLLQAQRDAAWGEVARRLAHEIKNPLTPIQLSAERLRHKLLGHIDEAQGQVLDRATHTIVQQVEAMKEMVPRRTIRMQ